MSKRSCTTEVASYWDWLPEELHERILLIARIQIKPIRLEDGEAYLREHAFDRVEAWLRLDPNRRGGWPISTNNFSFLYSLVFDLCTAKPPNNFSVELYDFAGKQAELVGRELGPDTREGRQWIRFFGHVFKYLDRFYAPRVRLPGLEELLRTRMALGVALRVE